MRILFVSGYFPPKAPIGAVRPGKLAEYWRDCGRDVRVIAVALPSQEWAHEEAPGVTAHYIGYSEPGRIVTRLTSAIRKSPIGQLVPSQGVRKSGPGTEPSLASGGAKQKQPGIAQLYRQALFLPDRYRSWIKPAVQLVQSWKGEWRPDIIYASGPPNSGHIVAKTLAAQFAVPWIAEIRDAWIDNPNGGIHWLIAPVFNRQASRTLSQAAGLVVVTDADRKQMSAAFPAPVVLSYNGYDPGDFQNHAAAEPLDREHLTILHAGAIYAGRRDPTPLFRAMSALGAETGKVRCLFFGEQTGILAALAESCGVRSYVEIGGVLRRSQTLLLERQVDILLECHWQDPAGDGVIPGKLFEYIGARRPILSLGSVTAEAAVIVRENGLGLASNDPEEIRAMLLHCIAAKQRMRRVPDIAAAADERFTRQYQFRKIDDLIRSVIAESV